MSICRSPKLASRKHARAAARHVPPDARGGGRRPAQGPAQTGPPEAGRIAWRTRSASLLCTKESLQTTFEELETSNEELKSTNEELQSTNEELQSTNEELETSKEEMQSLNEELTTVNAELQSKVEDLSRANDDMQNLLNSTDIATIFSGQRLNIKRFTDQAQGPDQAGPYRRGPPPGGLGLELAQSTTWSTTAAACSRRWCSRRRSRDARGRWYLMRILPYRTAENAIDGLVLTFVDISQINAARQEGQRARAFYEAIVDTSVNRSWSWTVSSAS